MTDDPPKYLAMDVLCWRCEHHWMYHYEYGCLRIINQEEVTQRNDRPKRCACKETVNHLFFKSIN